MYDDENDQYGFWHDEPTSPLERITARRRPAGPPPPAPSRPRPRPEQVQTGSRGHGETEQIPVVAGSRSGGVREFAGHIDPLLKRIGALAIATALFMPVAMSMRDDNSSRSALSPNDTTLAVGQAPGAPAAADGAGATPATDQAEQSSGGNSQSSGQQSPGEGQQVQATVAAEPASTTADTESTSNTKATPSAQPPAVEVAATQPAKCTKPYTVVAGDYWILIAKKVSVTLKELLAANGATTGTALYPGRSICLPANASAPTTAAPTTAAPTTAKPTTTTARPTTTTAKPTTTTAAPVAPKKNYTRAEVEAIIRQVWPDNLEDEAVRIATRESNLVPGVRNYCCYGLFQIYYSVHQRWLNQIGVTSATQLYDPLVNAYAAYVLYLRAGSWAPWRL